MIEIPSHFNKQRQFDPGATEKELIAQLGAQKTVFGGATGSASAAKGFQEQTFSPVARARVGRAAAARGLRSARREQAFFQALANVTRPAHALARRLGLVKETERQRARRQDLEK